jgi:uncharacterized protein
VDNHTAIQDYQFTGSGWAFPVRFSAGNLRLQTTAGAENINECINLVLMTRMGERCYAPGFGSGLQQFFFRVMDDTLKGEIINTVKASLLHNEPRISVKDVAVQYSGVEDGLAEIHIAYVINSSNTRHNHVFPFHLKEGTNLRR